MRSKRTDGYGDFDIKVRIVILFIGGAVLGVSIVMLAAGIFATLYNFQSGLVPGGLTGFSLWLLLIGLILISGTVLPDALLKEDAARQVSRLRARLRIKRNGNELEVHEPGNLRSTTEIRSKISLLRHEALKYFASVVHNCFSKLRLDINPISDFILCRSHAKNQLRVYMANVLEKALRILAKSQGEQKVFNWLDWAIKERNSIRKSPFSFLDRGKKTQRIEATVEALTWAATPGGVE